jgi:hypothetical protein
MAGLKKQKPKVFDDGLLANSKGQSLTLHSLAVGILSKSIINDLVGDEKLCCTYSSMENSMLLKSSWKGSSFLSASINPIWRIFSGAKAPALRTSRPR